MATHEWTLDFDSTAATVDTVGGKGASLAVLARAGLPVPWGFHVTTAAYREFMSRTGIGGRIAALMADGDPADHAWSRATADRIAGLFADHDLPTAVADAIRLGHQGLGDKPVAVRSSATAEDLADASFAGQMESYLNVHGADAVAAAVKDCWASLWTERAIQYRARNGFGADSVACAVVVQELADATAAGVVFTADPVTGRRDRTIINATWGLGEALVNGAVNPDILVIDTTNRAVLDRRTGDKTVLTVRNGDGTTEAPIPDNRRTAPVLTDAQALALAELGSRVAARYPEPMDIEWVHDGERFAIVQARPITNLPEPEPEREEWNDSRTGDFLWTSSNVGEAMPNVMTPLTWSLVQRTMAGAMAMPEVDDLRLSGNIGGRLYLNLTLMHGTADAVGMGGLMKRASALAFGEIPDDLPVPRLPIGRLALLRKVLPEAVRFQRSVRRYQKHLDTYLAEYPVRCDTARADIAAADDIDTLLDIWERQCAPLHRDGPRMLAAGSRVNGMALARLYPWLRKYVGAEDANVLAAHNHDGERTLASLGPLTGLRKLAAGEIDRDTYARLWGHRCPDELEVSAPRPGEDPKWIDHQLAGLAEARDVDTMLADRSAGHREALARFEAAHPGKVRALHRILRSAGAAIRAREATRSEATRCMWVLRSWVERAGELTGHGDDLYFLDVDELLAVMRGDRAPLARVAIRRATYAHYRSLPVYPVLIRGAFDPEAWARDPGRRRDRFDAADTAEEVAGAPIRGVPGSSGVVEGVARILTDPGQADRLAVGEILVTTVTNIGWTPIFPRAAAVVTDVGAPLSHAAIVARELGIPAAVGCGSATTRIADGDRIRVDGDAGTVDIVARA